MTPRKVRPNQVFQVFATILRLEFGTINVRVSVIKDKTEFAETVIQFDQPGSRMMQMKVRCVACPSFWKISNSLKKQGPPWSHRCRLESCGEAKFCLGRSGCFSLSTAGPRKTPRVYLKKMVAKTLDLNMHMYPDIYRQLRIGIHSPGR